MIAMSEVACFSAVDGRDRWAVMPEKLVFQFLTRAKAIKFVTGTAGFIGSNIFGLAWAA